MEDYRAIVTLFRRMDWIIISVWEITFILLHDQNWCLTIVIFRLIRVWNFTCLKKIMARWGFTTSFMKEPKCRVLLTVIELLFIYTDSWHRISLLLAFSCCLWKRVLIIKLGNNSRFKTFHLWYYVFFRRAWTQLAGLQLNEFPGEICRRLVASHLVSKPILPIEVLCFWLQTHFSIIKSQLIDIGDWNVSFVFYRANLINAITFFLIRASVGSVIAAVTTTFVTVKQSFIWGCCSIAVVVVLRFVFFTLSKGRTRWCSVDFGVRHLVW